MISALAASRVGNIFRPWNYPSNVIHYEADQQLTQSGGLVTGWSDIKGRGKTLVAPTGSGMTAASYQANDGDGRPAVRTNGTTDGLENLTWNVFDPDVNFTIAVLVWRTGATDAVFWSYGDHLDGLGRIITRVPASGFPGNFTGQLFSTTSLSDETVNAAASLNAWQIYWLRRSGSTFYTSVDGGAEQSKTVPGGAYNMAKFTLAHLRIGASGGNFTTGRFRALSVFSSDLGAPGTGARAKLRAFWKSRWPNVA
ncbi:MAG: hypothetical protein HOV80_17670 [Polyangiaceae bacterium]|nr:hypothetical protein [Polyangiaceae bacterium]